MLTPEQKQIIINTLTEKFNSLSQLIVDLGKAMYESASAYVNDSRKVSKYGTGGTYNASADTMKTNILGRHYTNVSSIIDSSTPLIHHQYIHSYLGNNTPDSSSGASVTVGWSFYNGKVDYRSLNEERLLHSILGFSSKTIAEVVNACADTNPNAIIKLSDFLDMKFKDELVAFVDRYIHECADGFERAYNEACEREAANDNILLAKFGLSNTPTKYEVKRYRIEVIEDNK